MNGNQSDTKHTIVMQLVQKMHMHSSETGELSSFAEMLNPSNGSHFQVCDAKIIFFR